MARILSERLKGNVLVAVDEDYSPQNLNRYWEAKVAAEKAVYLKVNKTTSKQTTNRMFFMTLGALISFVASEECFQLITFR